MPTTAEGFPYPDDNSPGDVPYWNQQLAEHTEQAAWLQGVQDGTPRRMHLQIFGGVLTDASGFVTYTHSAGFTPRCVFGTNMSPGTRYPIVWGIDQLTATTFRVRFENAAGTTVPNGVDTGPQGFLLVE